MEQTETVRRDRDEEIRRVLEEKREARKLKLIMRLGRNHSNPMNLIASAEALTGTLKSKKTAGNSTNQAQELEALPVGKVKPKKDEKKVTVKSSLSFRQTATSLKRANMASMGVHLKRSQSFKKLPDVQKEPVVEKKVNPMPAQRLQKLKLTVPQSPKFSARSQAKPVLRPAPAPMSLKSHMAAARQMQVKPAKPSTTSSKTSVAVESKVSVEPKLVVKRKSSTWMVPLTPEKAAVKGISSPRTPSVKPYVRKSFSDSKAQRGDPSKHAPRMVAPLARSQSVLIRKSVAPPNSILSRSVRIEKEPSEQEKIKQWLEKRGRSIASCRHLSCLGHQLKDFPTSNSKPTSKSSIRKSVKPSQAKHVESFSSPELKRKSSILNTTFEKGDDAKEEIVAPPPLEFHNEPQSTDASEETSESEEKFQTPVQDQSSAAAVETLPCTTTDELLQTISALFQEAVYLEAKIDMWIKQAEVSFPAVRSHALYWDAKARLEERRGNTIEALDIYSEALRNKAEPLDLMNQLFTEFQLRIGSELPHGQRTPLLKSFGVDTPLIQRSRRLTNSRRPLLDSTQVFHSTAIKYELKLKEIFQTAEKENKNGPSKRVSLKTPMKFVATEKSTVSVSSEVPYQLVATPVRRSMRPKTNARSTMGTVEEQVLYVDDLDSLSPTAKARATLRKNSALE